MFGYGLLGTVIVIALIVVVHPRSMNPKLWACEMRSAKVRENRASEPVAH
jgi:hypothetical protein